MERLLRLERKNIAYLRYIFEGYEGIANATTLDAQTALVKLQIAPDFVGLADVVLAALREEINLEICDTRTGEIT